MLLYSWAVTCRICSQLDHSSFQGSVVIILMHQALNVAEVSQGQCVLTLSFVRFSFYGCPKMFSFYNLTNQLELIFDNKCIWNFSRTKNPISYCRLVLYFRKCCSYYISKFLGFYFWLICYALCSGEINNASARPFASSIWFCFSLIDLISVFFIYSL